jgi:pimeloyl-ACP methyl ester carboxylesterase
MKVHEFGTGREKTFAMFPCTAEPWWAFRKSAEAIAEHCRVFLFMPDGHDESGADFVSVEKTVEDAARWLRGKGVLRLDAAYGVSMGGACVIRFLATQDIPVEKAMIDAGITPYPYPKWICRLIALRDFLFLFPAVKSLWLMKKLAPPERWTPEGEDPEEHYRKIYEFEKKHYSAKTIYNVFWSANNYSMPEPTPRVETRIEYWYGEEEKNARKNDLAYVRKAFPQTAPREFGGLAHAELVLMFPERFQQEVARFLRSSKQENEPFEEKP